MRGRCWLSGGENRKREEDAPEASAQIYRRSWLGRTRIVKGSERQDSPQISARLSGNFARWPGSNGGQLQ